MNREVFLANVENLEYPRDGGSSIRRRKWVKRCHCEPVRRLVWQSVLFTLPVVDKVERMEYYVYILTNKMNTAIYTGVTRDLVRRVYEHKHHMDSSSYTAKYGVTKLVYFESTSDVNAAIEREKQIKSWNRKRKNKLVESKNPLWVELYDSILR